VICFKDLQVQDNQHESIPSTDMFEDHVQDNQHEALQYTESDMFRDLHVQDNQHEAIPAIQELRRGKRKRKMKMDTKDLILSNRTLSRRKKKKKPSAIVKSTLPPIQPPIPPIQPPDDSPSGQYISLWYYLRN